MWGHKISPRENLYGDIKFPLSNLGEILCGDIKFPLCNLGEILCGDIKFPLCNIGEILCGDIKFPLSNLGEILCGDIKLGNLYDIKFPTKFPLCYLYMGNICVHVKGAWWKALGLKSIQLSRSLALRYIAYH